MSAPCNKGPLCFPSFDHRNSSETMMLGGHGNPAWERCPENGCRLTGHLLSFKMKHEMKRNVLNPGD